MTRLNSEFTPNTFVLDTFSNRSTAKTVHSQQRRNTWIWRAWFLSLIGIVSVVGLMMWRGGPSPSIIAWILYLLGVSLIIINPRQGLYMVLFLTLAGDFRLTPWYPFTKNFSSSESLLFFHDAIIVSPLETYLAFLYISWLGRGAMQRKLKFLAGKLFWPELLFAGFLMFGLMWGISRGGNLNIALWESRAIFYMPLIMVLTSNLLKTPKHANILMWCAMFAVFTESLFGNYFYLFILKRDLGLVDRIAAHSSAIHLNTFFIFLFSSWVFGASLGKRLGLPILLPFVALTYVAMQRRSGFLTLGIGLMLIAIILFQENRRVFLSIVPFLAVFGAIYTAVFWNNSGALGLPAQAIKSVVATDQANLEDQASDIYRDLENVNTSFTLHQAPLTGIGFGNKFYIIVSMPDISHFEFWEYITHNSVVWIWMKSGVGGFLSMLFLIGFAIMTGVRTVQRLTNPNLKAIVLTATIYVIMHFTYAYVDMSWDIESMIYMGVMHGLINVSSTGLLEPLKELKESGKAPNPKHPQFAYASQKNSGGNS